MAVSHSYFRGDGLNNTGYIDDYTYATAAKQSSKVSGMPGLIQLGMACGAPEGR